MNTITIMSRCHEYNGPEWVPEHGSFSTVAKMQGMLGSYHPLLVGFCSDRVWKYTAGTIAEALNIPTLRVLALWKYAGVSPRSHRCGRPISGQEFVDECRSEWMKELKTYHESGK